VCHQSVGLIARALEAAGTTTTSISSAWSITAAANPPRAVFTDFPLGNTAGPPNDASTQLAIARSVLDAAWTITEPGTILPLSPVWPEPWKDEARELIDHRAPRNDVPQYQSEADRVAAMERHGEAAECSIC
jgi:D-proline reductase (dithiol) PrdB